MESYNGFTFEQCKEIFIKSSGPISDKQVKEELEDFIKKGIMSCQDGKFYFTVRGLVTMAKLEREENDKKFKRDYK